MAVPPGGDRTFFCDWKLNRHLSIHAGAMKTLWDRVEACFHDDAAIALNAHVEKTSLPGSECRQIFPP